MRWVDVTRPMRPGMAVWPGDPAFEFAPLGRIGKGDSCNTSLLTFSTHTGTHVDAPWHFEQDGRTLDQVDPAVFFGEAAVMEIPDVPVIAASDLGEARLPERLLIKTRNSGFGLDDPFHTDFTALAPDAAQRLVDDGVRLVGIDYLSIAPFKKGAAAHHVLLGNNVFVVEGLVLRDIEPGVYAFVVLPLAVADADGAPCRAFIGSKE
jgi:arylformamidase